MFDDRDSPASPSEGSLLQGHVEVAGPPGNARFVKTEGQAQYHKQLGPNINGPNTISAIIFYRKYSGFFLLIIIL